MKNTFLLLFLSASVCCISLTGCGESGNTVIEAPPAGEEVDAAAGGMSDEDYAKEMEASMQ